MSGPSVNAYKELLDQREEAEGKLNTLLYLCVYETGPEDDVFWHHYFTNLKFNSFAEARRDLILFIAYVQAGGDPANGRGHHKG